MLEQQQEQLVHGLQDMYHKLQAANLWTGPTLSESTGHPLTHDILSHLGIIGARHDGSEDEVTFEENCENLQARLIEKGAGFVKRRESFSSESDRSHPERPSPRHTPLLAKSPDSFSFNTTPTQSPAPRQRQTFPPARRSPLYQNTPAANDPQLFQNDWTMTGNAPAIMQSRFALETPALDSTLDDVDDVQQGFLDSPVSSEFTFDPIAPLSPHSWYGYGSMADMDFLYGQSNMDFDFKNFTEPQGAH